MTPLENNYKSATVIASQVKTPSSRVIEQKIQLVLFAEEEFRGSTHGGQVGQIQGQEDGFLSGLCLQALDRNLGLGLAPRCHVNLRAVVEEGLNEAYNKQLVLRNGITV